MPVCVCLCPRCSPKTIGAFVCTDNKKKEHGGLAVKTVGALGAVPCEPDGVSRFEAGALLLGCGCVALLYWAEAEQQLL